MLWTSFPILLSFTSVLVDSAFGIPRHITRDASACCDSLKSRLPGKVFFPGDSTFDDQQSTYYTAEESALIPQCRVSPESAEEVSNALEILTAGSCPFAVRGGGHMAWGGAANIDNTGVTIDLSQLSSVSVSSDNSIAHVGSGARLGPVYDTLDSHNLTIVGGRSNTVGVGGYTLGGGISNLSPQHGLANDNVVNYEIVLANATVVNANASSNADLFWAMKAGSTNFGIITRYDLQTYPLSPMWGGFRGYLPSQEGDVLDAVQAFMTKLQADPKGGAAMNYGFRAGVESLFLDYAYLGADGSNTDLFSDMLAIPVNGGDTLRSNVNQQNLSAEIDAAFPVGTRTEWSCMSFKADTQLALDISAKAKDVFTPLNVKNITWSVNFQTMPIPTLQQSAAANNPQGLNPNTGDMYLLNINSHWSDAADDEAINSSIRTVLQFANENAQSRGLLVPWLYLNYALPDQDVYGSYPAESVSRLKQIQSQYDPQHVFANLWHGGFKL